MKLLVRGLIPGGDGRSIHGVTLDGDVLWDFPRQFVSFDSCHMPENESASGTGFPYSATDVSAALREYLDTPVETLLSTTFEHDKYGACKLLRAADRRLGVSRLAEHYGGCDNQGVEAILAARGAR